VSSLPTLEPGGAMDPNDLRQYSLFADLDDDALADVAGKFQELTVYPNTHLAKDGDFGYRFFVVVEGTADVFVGGEKVTELTPGDFFGEIALVEGDRRTASVESTSPMRLLTMMIWDYKEMTEAYPSITEKVDKVRQERTARDTGREHG
jgi:voltage-gated potassium channel